MSVAISKGSMGVAAISPEATPQLLAFRAQIIEMMNGKQRFTAGELRKFGQDMRTNLLNSDIGATWIDAAAGNRGLVTGWRRWRAS
ncbi:hypothetical protein [Reyranella sp.]|uniref:hypothetical protein n=1 Tax=Reyranella sp. TaxID=1929291 RepID=UPI003D1245A0